MLSKILNNSSRLGVIIISVRRFFCLFGSEVLGIRGEYSPFPEAVTWLGETPAFVSQGRRVPDGESLFGFGDVVDADELDALAGSDQGGGERAGEAVGRIGCVV